MVKTTTRPKCARVAKAKTQPIEDQIDAALEQDMPKAHVFSKADYPATLRLRPFDILKLSKEDLNRSNDAQEEEFRQRDAGASIGFLEKLQERDRMFNDRSCNLEDLVEFFPSQSIADACAQIYQALVMIERITGNDLTVPECEKYAGHARKLLLGAWRPVAAASERPLWEIMDIYLWMKAAEAFGDVERAEHLHKIRCSRDEIPGKRIFPSPVPAPDGDDSAFIADCEAFIVAEAGWAVDINAAENSDQEKAAYAKWDPLREPLMKKVFGGRPTTLAGHAARARACSAESGWEINTLESDGWNRGLAGALVRDLIGGAA